LLFEVRDGVLAVVQLGSRRRFRHRHCVHG
jgi:hypothetical protein